MFKIEKSFKVILSNDEVCEAIVEYIEKTSFGEVDLTLEDCSFSLKIPQQGAFFLEHSAGIKIEVETK